MKKIILYTLLACMLLGCQQERPEGASLIQSTEDSQDKNVIVVVIDSMTEAVLNAGMENNSLPALSYLADRGQVYHDIVAPFPSMSVAIESTLMTGSSVGEHQVPGLVWYDPDGDVIVDYGSTLSKYWKLGINDTLMNTLVHLNTNHLSPQVDTIYEEVKKEIKKQVVRSIYLYTAERNLIRLLFPVT
ncbi:hypothetical protein JCM9140_1657 [Halalkalibacter wakoensis JCM 9140]|uniref:Alkaline phosphodiesterase I n=1 Tax=Halalkalibacter wakoensis JCM 9140 TaxID=1236970 RepID=W4Q126_9BACI|nr:alkaline phosphatase family protein [Halalkalibacter wakoensis]GAE25650.1 hypothetical protein JCM9140_1657 [Halalkalibacter wakoensis JCM 9140]